MLKYKSQVEMHSVDAFQVEMHSVGALYEMVFKYCKLLCKLYNSNIYDILFN